MTEEDLAYRVIQDLCLHFDLAPKELLERVQWNTRYHSRYNVTSLSIEHDSPYQRTRKFIRSKYVPILRKQFIKRSGNNMSLRNPVYRKMNNRLSVMLRVLFSLKKIAKKLMKEGMKWLQSLLYNFLNFNKNYINRNKSKLVFDFSNKWITLVNRGRLVLVNDDFFIFVRRIENCARNVLKCPNAEKLQR